MKMWMMDEYAANSIMTERLHTSPPQDTLPALGDRDICPQNLQIQLVFQVPNDCPLHL